MAGINAVQGMMNEDAADLAGFDIGRDIPACRPVCRVFRDPLQEGRIRVRVNRHDYPRSTGRRG